MKIESDMEDRLKSIGADPTKPPIRQLNYLPFLSLDKEIAGAGRFSIFRFGYSPRIASVKLLNECNFNCSHCHANRIHGKRLSTEKVFQILYNLKEGGIQNVDFTGGEPTLRDDLFLIIEYSSKLGLWTTLNSNGGIDKGIKEEEDYWRNAAKAGLKGVNFSYDGVFPKNDPRVIDRASYILETLHKEAGIRTVVTQDNLSVVEEIGKLCMSNSIFFQAVPAVSLGGESSATSNDFHPLSQDGWKEYVEINHRLAELRGPFAQFLHMSNNYLKMLANASDPNLAWHCKKPSKHWISVGADGNARVCNDVALSKTYSLTGEENPLLDKKFHKDVTETSKKCEGCVWFCHWEGNRSQLLRLLDGWRYFLTIGAYT